MNDRFKFRAWDKTENAYIEDAQFTYDDGCEGGVGSFRHYSFRDLLEDKNCIVEQCTGLKDKNGELIYEGDVILVEDNKCLVEWEKENARYNVTHYGEIAYLNYNDIEVIGNMHENRELLDE